MSVSIYCPHCHKYTALSVAPVLAYDSRGRGTEAEAIWEDRGNKWWIGICNGCKAPSLVLNNGAKIYPRPLPFPTNPTIPKDIALDLDEAKMCFSTECYRACAIMIRRCLETACKMKSAKSKDLVNQIKELRKNGIITQDIENWATAVRWVGNDAAHSKAPVTKEDAEDCLRLAEQFLHVIFVAPAIAKSLKATRGK